MIQLDIKTPLQFLKTFGTNIILKVEGNLYEGTFKIRGDELIFDVFGTVKVSLAQFFKICNENLQISK